MENNRIGPGANRRRVVINFCHKSINIEKEYSILLVWNMWTSLQISFFSWAIVIVKVASLTTRGS